MQDILPVKKNIPGIKFISELFLLTGVKDHVKFTAYRRYIACKINIIIPNEDELENACR